MKKLLKRPSSRKGPKPGQQDGHHHSTGGLEGRPEEESKGKGHLETMTEAADQINRPSSAASVNKPLPGLPMPNSFCGPASVHPSPSLRQLTLSPSATPPRPSSASNAPSLAARSETWVAPEDTEGAYIRKTYAHFDASGIKGDGLVEGKEWTRERGSRAAWEASESASTSKKPLIRVNVNDKCDEMSKQEGPTRAMVKDGRLATRHAADSKDRPPTPTSLEVLNSPIDAGSLSASEEHASAMTSVEDGFRASSSSLGSFSIESSHEAGRGNGNSILVNDSDTELEVERKNMMKNIDRYGFFNKEGQTGQSTRSRLIVLPSSALHSVPKRRGGRQGLKSRREVRGSNSSDVVPSTSISADEPYRRSSSEKNGPSQQASLQSVIDGREGKEKMAREREAVRTAKWDRMLEVRKMDQGSSCYGLIHGVIKSKKLRKRVYKGIPDRWRSAAWWAILLEDTTRLGRLNDAEQDYKRLLYMPSPHDVQIDLDVPRTISGHVLFHTRYGQGQRSLFHVLHAFSLLCPQCAYCQGMGPIVATLLVYFTPEKAYAVMVELHNRPLYGIHQTFSPAFPGLVENFYVQKKLSKRLCGDVVASLESDGIMISSYATKWYITLYTNVLPFSTQLRLWDCFLLQGKDLLVVVAIAILWSLREQLIGGGFERAMKLLTREFIPVDDDALLNWIFLVMEREDTRKRMKEAREEYRLLIEQGKEPVL